MSQEKFEGNLKEFINHLHMSTNNTRVIKCIRKFFQWKRCCNKHNRKVYLIDRLKIIVILLNVGQKEIIEGI